jgi:hypothetical protein
MTNFNFKEDDYVADLVDAMADIVYEQEQAMRESNMDEWTGIATDNDQTNYLPKE